MSKAVLIIDMPESCDMCDFVDDSESGKMWCGLPTFGYDVTDCIACRPDDCPLKALPDPIDVSGCKTEITRARAKEYNALLARLTT